MSFKAALIQMRSGVDMARNFSDASAMIREAAVQGAQYVLTPEMTNIFEADRERLKSLVRREEEDACVAGFSQLAQELHIWLHAGSLALRVSADRLVNRSLLFAPDGALVARYDKIHLFDVDMPSGERIRESDTFAPGNEAVVANLPWGPLGLSICYDMRFPNLYNTLANAGAMFMAVPAAFTVPTGKAHWHVLLRSRAIETGSFVFTAAQGGAHECGRHTFGHSLAVTPWGEIMVEAGIEPGVLVFEVDEELVNRDRGRIPALKNARAFNLKLTGGMVI
ncbi:MAG TPA: carbon-nitrogen hydrolase family protein [Aestuariivirga sp.]|nr:carbon-nitrogen hydrolase family protein [Aestuariivirga sp.]